MSRLDRELVKKYKRGELAGNVAVLCCAAVTAAFAACFAAAQAYDNFALLLTALIAAPILICAGAGVAAYCYCAYTKKLEKLCAVYIKEALSENAAKLRPERSALAYTIAADERELSVGVTGSKDKIVIGFSEFGKLSALRKANLCECAAGALVAAFCRLYERGAEYRSVSYSFEGKNKIYTIISEGEPDKTAYKKYLRGSAE